MLSQVARFVSSSIGKKVLMALSGLALIGSVSMLTAPWGARVAHSLSRRRLAQAFGAFLLVVGGRMIYRALA